MDTTIISKFYQFLWTMVKISRLSYDDYNNIFFDICMSFCIARFLISFK